MEVILKQDVENLGHAGEMVKVKPGYARNFLIPKKLAVIATESNRKIIMENQRQVAHKLAKIREEAEARANLLKKQGVTIPVKVGTSGKLFGSITPLMVSRALKDLGYEVDRKDITFQEEMGSLGTYKFNVKLHKEVNVELTLNIVKEED